MWSPSRHHDLLEPAIIVGVVSLVTGLILTAVKNLGVKQPSRRRHAKRTKGT